MDDHNHGTHVSGTIGASGNNGVGVVGVNWITQLMGIKFLDANGSGSRGRRDQRHRLRHPGASARSRRPAARTCASCRTAGAAAASRRPCSTKSTAANANDMLFVAAAGNNGFNNDVAAGLPGRATTRRMSSRLRPPTNADARAYFSNYGATSVHLGAPGIGHSLDDASATPTPP